MTYDAIVIGAGVNGLACAAYLARAGRRVIVLERNEHPGGTAATEEFQPGFRANACRDDPGWIPPRLVRELRLAQHGLRLSSAPTGLVAVNADSPPVVTWPDVARTVDALRSVAPDDAQRWPRFCALVHRVAGVLEVLYRAPPPRVQSHAAGDYFALLALGRRVRSLGRHEMMEVLRAVPMPVSDLVEEWVSHPSLAAALATEGIRHVQHGPMSSGTGFVFFHRHVGSPEGALGVRRVVQGGTGRLADAIADSARTAGCVVRTGVDVSEVAVRSGAVQGVVTSTGESFEAPTVVSSADPQRTFALVDPLWLDSELLGAVDNVRMRGATARVHFALDGLPSFATAGRPWDASAMEGTINVAPGVSGIERAYDDCKYGQVPGEPVLTLSLPSLSDPTLAPSGRHVASVDVHQVPFARSGGWSALERDALGDLVEVQLARVAWDFRDHILARWVLTPADLESRYALSGASLTHGELALDQILFMRPVPDCARYATPLAGLWLCGIGTHPASAGGASGMLAAREILRAKSD